MDKELEDIKKLSSALEKYKNTQADILNSSEDESEDEEMDLDSDFQENQALYLNYDELESFIIEKTYQEETLTTNNNLKEEFNAIKNYLPQDELEEIDSCPIEEIKEAMMLNRIKCIKLRKFKSNLMHLLQSCLIHLEKHFSNSTNTNNSNLKGDKNYLGHAINRLAYPYFKDLKKIMAPLSKDALLKQSRRELNPFYLLNNTIWTLTDQKTLIELIKHYCYGKYIKENGKNGNKNINVSLYYPPKDDETLDWGEIVDNSMAGRHSELSCKSIWNIYLKPSINNAPYTKQEEEQLEALANKHNKENWDLIASELKTNRSAFSACVHFYSKLNNKLKYTSKRFNKEEDDKLMNSVIKHSEGNYIPWYKVGQEFTNRNTQQLMSRYNYLSKIPEYHVQGQFTNSEDILLYILMNKFRDNKKEDGNINYKLIKGYFPHRSLDQIKHRIKHYLLKLNISLGNWTLKEDQKILEHVKKHGNINFNQLEQELPRNRFHLYHRHKTLKAWMEKNPGKGIESMKRRSHMQLKERSKKYQLIKKIAQNFTKKIPTLLEIEQFLIQSKKQLNIRNSNIDDVIDKQLIQHFINNEQDLLTTKNKKRKINHVDDENYEEEELQIKRLCQVFNVKFNLKKMDMSTNLKSRLDDFDIKFLNNCQNFDNTQTNEGKELFLVPPCLNTLQTLRNLLINYKINYKDKLKSGDLIKNHDLNLNFDFDKLFYDRFYQLLKWPCVLSVNQPSSLIVNNVSNVDNDNDNIEISVNQIGDENKKVYTAKVKLSSRALRKVHLSKVQKMLEAKKRKRNQEMSEGEQFSFNQSRS